MRDAKQKHTRRPPSPEELRAFLPIARGAPYEALRPIDFNAPAAGKSGRAQRLHTCHKPLLTFLSTSAPSTLPATRERTFIGSAINRPSAPAWKEPHSNNCGLLPPPPPLPAAEQSVAIVRRSNAGLGKQLPSENQPSRKIKTALAKDDRNDKHEKFIARGAN
eukprot:GHVT01084623.1.p1 GENE.GHVT01084623.1~~GHVT01084623.1.p1  ORF type:complete len:163 (-),score=30.03 GHVT01084623.1:623-1111(-)